MPEINLWLIRHGESSINAGNWSAHPAEAPLTALGQQQMQKTAAEILLPPNLIISSPLCRARDSAHYILQQWPDTPSFIWPIQEIIYLSPSKLAALSPPQRKEKIQQYWEKNDPDYCDGMDAESFRSFLFRVNAFHQQILCSQGFIIVVGHGQFFKAYQIGLTKGFEASAEWMKFYREQETNYPLRNGEIDKYFLNS